MVGGTFSSGCNVFFRFLLRYSAKSITAVHTAIMNTSRLLALATVTTFTAASVGRGQLVLLLESCRVLAMFQNITYCSHSYKVWLQLDRELSIHDRLWRGSRWCRLGQFNLNLPSPFVIGTLIFNQIDQSDLTIKWWLLELEISKCIVTTISDNVDPISSIV